MMPYDREPSLMLKLTKWTLIIGVIALVVSAIGSLGTWWPQPGFQRFLARFTRRPAGGDPRGPTDLPKAGHFAPKPPPKGKEESKAKPRDGAPSTRSPAILVPSDATLGQTLPARGNKAQEPEPIATLIPSVPSLVRPVPAMPSLDSNNGWNILRSSWRISEGVLKGTDRSDGRTHIAVWNGGYGWADYTVGAFLRIQGEETPSGAALIFRYQERTNFGSCRILRHHGSTRFELLSLPDAVSASTSFDLKPGEWHHVRATVRSNSVTCQIDDGTPLSGSTGSERGTIGFRQTGGEAWFKDLKITLQ